MNRTMRRKKNTEIQQAKQKLHPCNTFDEMICRQKEYNDIYNFAKSSLVEQVGGCMFISGVPGSGKTATVRHAMRKLVLDDDLKKMKDKIVMLEINCLQMTIPNQFYSTLCCEIFNQKIAKQKAIKELEEFFNYPNPRNPFIVLLVDELDQLSTRKQDVLYHLFDWPNRPGARIIIFSIANIMDLPERMMMYKIQSRLGLRRLPFQAYRHDELFEIINYRLGDSKSLFEEAGLSLISRKVASISGDARRVLDLCRKALDFAEEEFGSDNVDQFKVGMKHVKSALEKVFSTDKVISISNCSEQEKTFLHALMQEFRINDSEDAQFENVYHHHAEKCRMDKIYVPTVQELIDVAYDLYEKRLILIESKQIHPRCKIQLNVSIEEIEFVLGQI